MASIETLMKRPFSDGLQSEASLVVAIPGMAFISRTSKVMRVAKAETSKMLLKSVSISAGGIKMSQAGLRNAANIKASYGVNSAIPRERESAYEIETGKY